MDDMTVGALVMAGVAFVIAVSWQFAGRRPFDAIEFAARFAVFFIGAAVMTALLYGLVFVIGMSNIAGSGFNMGAYLKAFFWLSIGIAFVIAASRSEERRPLLLRFIARWIVTWVCVVGAGMLLMLGFCAAMFSV
jgi:hypothetical protein